ncbi:UNVERIFIED_CONTAM: hypothetical protein PYX00_004626 [Menopon gallinae]|uniref:DJ-1/PfpI domain-containing protein n=1 Tax=Menopon gallinae TaxID=328185 RepID=A0AAW2I6F9_9NEOP
MSFLVRSFTAAPKLYTNLVKFNFYSSMAKKSALVVLSEGSEDMECVISVDVLRRGGIDVTVAGLQGNKVLECQGKVKIQPDTSLEEAANKQFDVVVLPGGMKGSEAFCASNLVGKILKEQESSGRLIAAICAAPLALKAHGVCSTKKITSYPSMEKEITEGQKFTYLQDKVVVDGNLITSRGPGTAVDFALAIVDKLMGKETASTTAKRMLLEY